MLSHCAVSLSVLVDWHMFVQCTELVPAVAAGIIQWARVHWPAEKICQSVDLCDAAALTTSQVSRSHRMSVLITSSTASVKLGADAALLCVVPPACECHL